MATPSTLGATMTSPVLSDAIIDSLGLTTVVLSLEGGDDRYPDDEHRRHQEHGTSAWLYDLYLVQLRIVGIALIRNRVAYT